MEGDSLGVRSFKIIANGIDVEAFCERAKAAKSAVALEAGVNWVGFFGRLAKEKNIGTLIRAMAHLGREGKNIKLLICGEGEERAELEDLRDSLSLQEKVKFAGFVDDISGLYPELLLYASSSLREGMANNILEAQALGVPCVVSDIAANREIVQDGVSGLLLAVNDDQGFSQAILRLFSDKKFANSLSQAAKNNLVKRFSLKDRLHKLEAHYRSLMEGS